MKTPPCGGVFMMVSISGILCYVVIYLGPMLPLSSSGTPREIALARHLTGHGLANP